MPTVGFLTSAENALLTADDRLSVPFLEARGVRVVPIVWTDETADVERFDLVVIRSTWDWYRQAKRFDGRLRAIAERTRVLNAEAWRWLDKRYLLALGERGASVAPCRVIHGKSELGPALEELAAPEAVLKPATAAAGYRTVRFRTNELDVARAALDAILEEDVALLQPFFPEIETDGEWSLIFFGGRYSHAIKKRPRSGEFRIHEEFGGTIARATPPADVLEAAHAALAASGQEPLYARVDGIVLPARGGFHVTELELVEPELFLRMHEEAPARFAAAIADALGV